MEYSQEDIEEIEALEELGCMPRWSILEAIAPKAHAFYQSVIDDLKSDRITLDEAGNCFAYTMQEICELVYQD